MNFFTKELTNFSTFISLLVLSICSLITYSCQFNSVESYAGSYFIQQISEVEYWLICILWITALTFNFPKKISRPSDIFILIYLIGALLWNSTLWPSTGLLSSYNAIFLLVILLSPIVAIKLLQFFSQSLFRTNQLHPQLTHSIWLLRFMVFFIVLSLIFSYQIAGQNGSFEYNYSRRILGRDIFQSHLPIAYLFEMSTNGLIPFLAYYSGIRKSFFYFILAIFFSICVFWLLGIKSVFIFSFLMFFAGYSFRTGLVKYLPNILIIAFILIFIISFIENYMNHNSLIYNYFIIRITISLAEIQAYFFDAMQHMDGLSFLWSGLDLKGLKSPEFLIGLQYLGNPESNASVNAYQHQIAMNGFFAYLLIILCISTFLIICDYLYATKINEGTYAITLILAFLLREQAFTTALLSSGIFLCLLLGLIFSNKRIEKN